MAQGASKLAWRVVGTGSAIAAGTASRKALTKVWTRWRGTPPPSNPASPDAQLAEALAWAVVTGVAVGVSRMLATRTAARGWVRLAGGPPPGTESVSP